MTKAAPAAAGKFRQPIAIEYHSPSALTPDPRNARRHSRKQITKLAAAVSRFGFNNPILVDEKLRVIAGHARREAALELKLDPVPCIRLVGLSDEEKIALAIADNKLGDLSEFDPAMLAELLAELEGLAFDVDLTGFDTAEIDILTSAEPTSPAADPADAVAVPIPGARAVSVIGDLWQLGTHRLYAGDALDTSSFAALLGEERAAMVFTDVPYNVSIPKHASGLGKARHGEFAMASGEMSKPEFTAFLTSAMRNMATFSVDGSIHYHCIDWRHAAELLEAGSAAYTELKALCVWNKGSGGMGSLYRSQHELIFVFKRGTRPHVNNVELGKNGRYRTNVWNYPGLNSFGRGRDEALASHPTVKPTALVADAIRDCSKRSALILDPFAGSGTTIVAAERTGRRARAMEIDPRYVDTAVRRWQTLTSNTATLVGDGRSFAQLEAERAQASRQALSSET